MPEARDLNDIEPTYDDRDGWIWHDGKLVPWREAKVHVLTHALHYASSVFEGARAYNGTIFALDQHSQRLRDSAAMLGFELRWSLTKMVGVMLAGVVPFLSFWAEHRVTRQARARIAAGAPEPAPARR